MKKIVHETLRNFDVFVTSLRETKTNCCWLSLRVQLNNVKLRLGKHTEVYKGNFVSSRLKQSSQPPLDSDVIWPLQTQRDFYLKRYPPWLEFKFWKVRAEETVTSENRISEIFSEVFGSFWQIVGMIDRPLV